MRAIALYAGYNLPGRRDSSGAFKPEAIRFAELHGTKAQDFDNRLGNVARSRAVENLITTLGTALGGEVELIALFCHGWRAGLQTGHRLRTVRGLADAIARSSAPHVRVVLYACSTGAAPNNEPGGEGGFADTLRDALVARGCRGGWVDAHTKPGHTTKMPYLRRFLIEESVKGGEWVVEPVKPPWARWKRQLKSTDLRFRFPFETSANVRAELSLIERDNRRSFTSQIGR